MHVLGRGFSVSSHLGEPRAGVRSGTMLGVCLVSVALSACGSGGGGVDEAALGLGGAVEAGVSIPVDKMGAIVANPSAATSNSLQPPTEKPLSSESSPASIAASDPRVIYWIDPRLSFADQRKWGAATQISGPNKLLADVREPGVIGAGSDYALSRVTDPVDSNRTAFRHRIASSFPTWGNEGARRSEISADWSTNGATVMRGVEYWVAFAFKFDPDMFGSGNGSVELLDFHQVPDSGENWLPSSFAMYGGENGISFVTRWDQGQPTIGVNPPSKTLWSETGTSTGQWHRFVMKMKLHWDPAQKPYIQIWRAVGDGPMQQIVDYSGPNDYRNDAPYVPQKYGLYRWDSWSGKATRTLYTKGLLVMKNEGGAPALDQNVLMETLKAF